MTEDTFRGRRLLSVSEPLPEETIDNKFLMRITGDVWVEEYKPKGWEPHDIIILAPGSKPVVIKDKER